MTIAIIGGGFAGLASAYFLFEANPSLNITLFEQKEIGAGASGVASGLVHPYPGLGARRSAYASEGLGLTKMLIRLAEENTPLKVATEGGIFRQSLNREQRDRLLDHAFRYKDVEQTKEDLFFIHTGITVESNAYLKGLFHALQKKGLKFIQQKVNSLDELKNYDAIVIAAGYGIREFPECSHLKYKFLKGQALEMEGTSPFERSLISKGYIAYFGNSSRFEVGSTYERDFFDDRPNLEKAVALLQDKLSLCPHAKVVNCRAGVRVAMVDHYLPTIQQVAPKAYVFTGLGSRGLLYHAFFGKRIAEMVIKAISNNENLF